MTKYTATCDYDSADAIRAFTATGGVWVTATQESDEVSIKLLPANARTFARGILALADEVDEGEAKPTPTPAVKAGDRVRVTEDDVNDAGVCVGDVLTVARVYVNGDFYTREEDWWFKPHHIGNGLEVLPADEPEPAPTTYADPSRLALFNEAKALARTGATDAELISLARFLAGE